jgi:hypothetical protein
MEAPSHVRELYICPAYEWQAGVDLAVSYLLFDYFGWTMLEYTRISARILGKPRHMKIKQKEVPAYAWRG